MDDNLAISSSSSSSRSLASSSTSLTSSLTSSTSSTSTSSISSLIDSFVTLLHARFLGNYHHYPNDILYYCYPDNECEENKHDHVKPQVCQRDNLPNKKDNFIRIIIVSDTHDRHDFIGKIPTGDIFLHCGDIFMTSRFFSVKNALQKIKDFNLWLELIPIEKNNKLIIGGNHDLFIELLGSEQMETIITNGIYLENKVFHIGNLTCYATPLSSGKSSNKAFQSKAFKKKTLESIPNKVDILVTHGHCAELEQCIDHKIHIWGHAHNAYGIRFPGEYLRNEPIKSLSICAPIMDKSYNLSHLPIILDVPIDSNNMPYHPMIESNNNVKRSKRNESLLTRIKRKILYNKNDDKIIPSN